MWQSRRVWPVRERLYLGDYESAELALAGEALPIALGGPVAPFAGIVSLCAVPLFSGGPAPRPAHLETQWLQVPIADGGSGDAEFAAALRLVSPFVHRRRQVGNVLIHCAAGMSRSVSMIAALLCEEGLEPGAAFTLVARAKATALQVPIADAALLIAPAPEFRAYLSRLHAASDPGLDGPRRGGA